MKKTQPLIRMERGENRLLPRDFGEILTRRYFPVLSLTYISSVIGIAAQKGDVLHYMLHDKTAYIMALFVGLWMTIPAVVWILLRGTHLYNHLADDWYKIVSILMMVTLCLSFVLFPETDIWGLRIFLAATIPMLIVMYLFFVKGGLPALAAHPLTALGLTFLLYGATLGYWH